MPRAPRIEFAGAIYHVMNRGNHLEPIFKDAQDRIIFLKTLQETCASAGWAVHSFVLMGNHYHLLIETQRPTLVKGMQYLNSTYTQRYNVRFKTRGHLFQGRYKALLVDGETPGYFLTVSDYIHLNPLRIRNRKIFNLRDLLKYPWSSAGWLSGSRKGRPEWLRWERVYGELSLRDWKGGSRREYRQYLERRIEEVKGDEEGWKKIRRGWCLGREGFVAKMKERLEEMGEKKPRERESWAGEAVEEMEADRAMRVMAGAVEKLGYHEVGDLKGMDRYWVARLVRSQTKVSVGWVARKLGLRTREGLSSAISRLGRLIETNPKAAKKWKSLILQ